MSYSFNSPCWNCATKDECKDHAEVQEAVQRIHNRTIAEGHKGAGQIVLMCCRQQAVKQ